MTTPITLDSNAAPPANAANQQKRIHDAAQQFEALMVGEMLKAARDSSSDGWLGSGGSTGDDSAMDMAQSQFANALASGGGLGLASVIERAMTPYHAAAQNTSQSVDSSSKLSSHSQR